MPPDHVEIFGPVLAPLHVVPVRSGACARLPGSTGSNLHQGLPPGSASPTPPAAAPIPERLNPVTRPSGRLIAVRDTGAIRTVAPGRCSSVVDPRCRSSGTAPASNFVSPSGNWPTRRSSSRHARRVAPSRPESLGNSPEPSIRSLPPRSLKSPPPETPTRRRLRPASTATRSPTNLPRAASATGSVRS